MSANPLLVALVDRVLALLPDFTRNLQDSIQQAVREHPALQEAWMRRRSRFQFEFDTSVRPMLAQVRNGQDPLAPKRNIGLDQLALVDEANALRDVGIALVVETVSEACRTELFQLTNFFNGLARGQARPPREPNLLRPALFARALTDALAGTDLRADGHYALMHAIAPGMSDGLVPIYQALADELRRNNLTPLVMAVDFQHNQLRPHGGAAGGLEELRRRTELEQPDQFRVRRVATPGSDLVNKIYDQMMADPLLLQPVKAQLERLKPVVLRMAQLDDQLLRQQDHPTWRLLNAVAAYGRAFQDPHDPRLGDYLQFLDQQGQLLADAPMLNRQQFESLQRLMDAFIARQARERSTASSAAIAALEREGRRAQWANMVREQLEAQLYAARISPSVREFLLGIWLDVIVQAMVSHGEDSHAVQDSVQLVDDLVESLAPLHVDEARTALQQRLPELIGRITRGLATIPLSDAKRQAILEGLQRQHMRAMRGGVSEAARREPAPFRPSSSGEAGAEGDVRRLLDERESQFASVWAHAEVDRSELPTQPMPLPDAGDTGEVAVGQWMRQLEVGGWFHMFLETHWVTTQLVWISEDREFFAFIDQDGHERHSLTAGAVAQLYKAGLVMYLEQEGVVDRAVAKLIQQLDA
ncbi:DUF1631 family protein [Inhella gelatinilytica]|uniref:DUF1631 family protein n=1 Tax=Inhella gelatinilytica TaxID=2795030 RepID=A0A931N9D2_9BURK|nr:DUF1631 family protein [Inhella gelatinilytica]MBH9551238.1 DUF1631 family protein [Inhella gelatinilytica]